MVLLELMESFRDGDVPMVVSIPRSSIVFSLNWRLAMGSCSSMLVEIDKSLKRVLQLPGVVAELNKDAATSFLCTGVDGSASSDRLLW